MTIPGLHAVATYQRQWLPRDVVAGLVLASLLVPQGMAYAELAGLPPITGLYTSILCLVGYAIFGPSRILVLGPDSALGPMIAATILPLVAANGDPATAVAYASMLALMVGGFMLIGARAGLGFVADLLSKPTQIGYMNGLALTILVGQLPKLFGFSTDADGLIGEVVALVEGLAAGEAVAAAVGIGLFSLALLLVLGRVAPVIPSVLVTVIVAMVLAYALDLAAKGVSLVGVLPSGLPPFTIPIVPLADLPLLVAGAIGIAVVSLADTISTSTAFAARTGQEVRANQEMVGIGAANVGAGLFAGFPVSTSGSRTAVAERAGAKTQLTGVVGAAVIAVMLVFLPGLMQYLPQPTLAAVVIVASHFARGHSCDAPPVAAATRRVRAVDGRVPRRRPVRRPARHRDRGDPVDPRRVPPGLEPVPDTAGRRPRTWRATTTSRCIPTPIELPGLVIYRFDGPLIFANAKTFRSEVREFARTDPPPRWIVIASEPITDVDTTAADMLDELEKELEAAGIHLVFAEMKDVVRQKIRDYGVELLTDKNAFYPTIGTAVKAYREVAGIPKPDHHVKS